MWLLLIFNLTKDFLGKADTCLRQVIAGNPLGDLCRMEFEEWLAMALSELREVEDLGADMARACKVLEGCFAPDSGICEQVKQWI